MFNGLVLFTRYYFVFKITFLNISFLTLLIIFQKKKKKKKNQQQQKNVVEKHSNTFTDIASYNLEFQNIPPADPQSLYLKRVLHKQNHCSSLNVPSDTKHSERLHLVRKLYRGPYIKGRFAC